MGIGAWWHWLVVLLVVVLIFGTKKLRNIGGDVGGAVKNFKDAMNDGKSGSDTAGSGQKATVQGIAKTDAIEAEFVEAPVEKAAPKRKAAATKKTAATKATVAKPKATATKKAATAKPKVAAAKKSNPQ